MKDRFVYIATELECMNLIKDYTSGLTLETFLADRKTQDAMVLTPIISFLIISHRFSTVRMADKIYVPADGKISESGTHQELMEHEGMYAEMYGKQAAWMA